MISVGLASARPNYSTMTKGGGSGMAGVAFAIPLFSSIGNAIPHLKATQELTILYYSKAILR